MRRIKGVEEIKKYVELQEEIDKVVIICGRGRMEGYYNATIHSRNNNIIDVAVGEVAGMGQVFCLTEFLNINQINYEVIY